MQSYTILIQYDLWDYRKGDGDTQKRPERGHVNKKTAMFKLFPGTSSARTMRNQFLTSCQNSALDNQHTTFIKCPV